MTKFHKDPRVGILELSKTSTRQIQLNTKKNEYFILLDILAQYSYKHIYICIHTCHHHVCFYSSTHPLHHHVWPLYMQPILQGTQLIPTQTNIFLSVKFNITVDNSNDMMLLVDLGLPRLKTKTVLSRLMTWYTNAFNKYIKWGTTVIGNLNQF